MPIVVSFDTTGITIKRKDFIDIDSEKQLKLLQNQKVKEFNDYYSENVLAHLPYAELQELKLGGINLDHSMLFNTNLSGADLSGAFLSGADLTNSIIVNNIFSEDTVVADTTNFKDAIIDSQEFLEHLRKNQCKNIPEEEIRNKQELRLKLESKNMSEAVIVALLSKSKLPSSSNI